jgi:hypothetical protein
MPRRVSLLLAALLLGAALLACSDSSTPPPDASGRATSLAQTAAALLTATAQASITPLTPTSPPTDTPIPPAATDTAPPPPAPTTAVPPAASTPCTGENDSEFVADVNVPDGTHFAAGAAFTKTWRLRNDGTCTWTTAYTFRHVGGAVLGGVTINLAADVPPGATVDLSVSFVAPASNGTHVSRWQLHTPDGVAFGTRPYVEIIVP